MMMTMMTFIRWFQHTAARRRLGGYGDKGRFYRHVSTHSRPKAAGSTPSSNSNPSAGFNTQPPEGGWTSHITKKAAPTVSTHSRPKAAGTARYSFKTKFGFQHTAARRRLGGGGGAGGRDGGFQHTAARRRLGGGGGAGGRDGGFQHTAARRRLARPPAASP